MDLKFKKNTYSSVLHSHTLLMNVCPCGKYRQQNSVLYPNNHILKSSTIKGLLVLAGSLKVGKLRFVLFFLPNSTRIPSLEAFIKIYLC